jgi:hypothetical protein
VRKETAANWQPGTYVARPRRRLLTAAIWRAMAISQRWNTVPRLEVSAGEVRRKTLDWFKADRFELNRIPRRTVRRSISGGRMLSTELGGYQRQRRRLQTTTPRKRISKS